MKTPDSSVMGILIVEDEPAIRDLCRRVLASEGFEVDAAANGEIAQGMLEWRQYDLCLIDIWLPAVSGMELYRWLKEKHPQLANQVIFTTGDVVSSDIQGFLEQANRLFLPKPFTPDELRTAVRETLGQVER